MIISGYGREARRQGYARFLEMKWEPAGSSEGPGIGPYEAEGPQYRTAALLVILG